MAYLRSDGAFNFDTADLSRLTRFFAGENFYNDVHFVVGGRTYPDVYDVFWSFNGSYFLSTFGGVDLGITPGVAAGGTVTGYLESAYSGGTWVPWWSIQDVSVPANSLYQAALTASTTDDYALFQALLSGNDTAELSQFGDLVRTFGGDDVIVGNGGNDYIDAGAGWDTALFSGLSGNYKLAVDPASVSIIDKRGIDGTDTLVGVEKLQFVDKPLETGWFTKAASVPAAQFADLTDMYIAYFDRAPDAVGLFYWASRLHDGMTLPEIARSFFVQPETITAYPANQTATEFVTKVYDNMLGRAPDVAGLNYWVNDLQAGNVSKDEFMLAVIYGARASTGSPLDVQYLANKNAVGRDFAVTEGLNNVEWAKNVMAAVNSDLGSVQTAYQVIDGYAAAANAPGSSELIVELIGVTS